MTIKLNLQFKLLITVATIIIVVLVSLGYLTIKTQEEFYQTLFRDSAITLAQALDASIGSKEELKNLSKLQSDIYKTMWLNSNIVQISISLPTDDGFLVVASNNTSLINTIAIPEYLSSYQEGIILTHILTNIDGKRIFRVITPVHVGGQRVGTYDLRLSLESSKKNITETQNILLFGVLMTILIIIYTLSLLIKKTVIVPIKELEKGIKRIGAGDLDHRIDIGGGDEMENLASGLNIMASKLKYRTEDLAREKIHLEEKVEQRTKELQERVNELESFHKLTIDRELKMIELKDEIKRLKVKKQKRSKKL
jgi:phosphoglycerate-specific signal transduction histidine kinase